MKYKPMEHVCVDCKTIFTTTTDSSVQKCEKCHVPTQRDADIIKIFTHKK